MTIMTRKGAEFWWNLSRKLKIIIPPEVCYYTKNLMFNNWEVTTWKDVFAERKRKQENNISLKQNGEKILPCFIWVFHNKHFPFGGWYIVIRTLKKDFSINFRHEKNDDLVIKAMQMYPCGIIPILDNFYDWAEKFAVTYHHKGFKRTVQGLKLCACRVKNNTLMDIDFNYLSIN